MIHVKKLIDIVNTADRSNHKQITIEITDAKKISYDLSQLMTDYIALQNEIIKLKNQVETTNIEMDGGEW